MKVIIGIDPGIHCGVFVITKSASIGNKYDWSTSNFWDTINLLSDYHKQSSDIDLMVYIENPNLNKPIFNKKGANNHNMVTRVAQNVGSNKREASLMIEYMVKNGIKFTEVKPISTKWSKDMFIQVTGIKERISQHCIDACRMVWGR